jgi:hypothetical protein
MQSLLVSFRYTDVSKVHTVSINKGDETSLYFETTRRYIPEDYHLHTHRWEKLTSHITMLLFTLVFKLLISN